MATYLASASRTTTGGTSEALFSLKALSSYSGLSVRTLRNHLRAADHALPHFRVGAKILVRRSEFDAWLSTFRFSATSRVDAIVDGVLADLRGP